MLGGNSSLFFFAAQRNVGVSPLEVFKVRLDGSQVPSSPTILCYDCKSSSQERLNHSHGSTDVTKLRKAKREQFVGCRGAVRKENHLLFASSCVQGNRSTFLPHE